MPIVFDEVVATVEPEAPARGEQPAREASQRESELDRLPPMQLQSMCERLEQRMARLWAD